MEDERNRLFPSICRWWDPASSPPSVTMPLCPAGTRGFVLISQVRSIH